MSRDRVALRPEVAEEVRDELSRHGIVVGDLGDPVRSLVARLLDGAGELAPELDDDATGFELSWTVALTTLSSGLGNVAANVGGFSVDLQAVDLDLTD